MITIIRFGSDFYRYDGTYWKKYSPDIFKKGTPIQCPDKTGEIELDKSAIIGFENSLMVFDIKDQIFRPLDKTDYLFTPFDIPYKKTSKEDAIVVKSLLKKYLFNEKKSKEENKENINRFIATITSIINPKETTFNRVIFDETSLGAVSILHTIFRKHYSYRKIDYSGNLVKVYEAKRYKLFNYTSLQSLNFNVETITVIKESKEIEIFSIDRNIDHESEFKIIKGSGYIPNLYNNESNDDADKCFILLNYFLKIRAKELQ